MPITAHRQLPSTSSDAALARTSGCVLARYVGTNRPLRLHITDAGQEKLIELPAGAVTLLMNILDAMATGQGVTLVPEHVELTTVEAAEILAVSRPFLIKLLDEGAIPHRKVGTHRRVRLEDVIAYKEKIDQEREAVVDLFRARWTADIHREWIEALQRREPYRDRISLERTRSLMDQATRDAPITDYESLVPTPFPTRPRR